jgi:condensin-2 complex subunit H2
VAKDLEEYLDDLEHVQISFDGGRTSLNFAQAALLIQGSACIYSRKVEYLYTLIYQTLDMITTQAKKGKVRGCGGRGVGVIYCVALRWEGEDGRCIPKLTRTR